ncbi:hypothetical protein BU202_02860 [Streptococcus cuniculi]|uniref:Uncharacterized protein n=1 Tax=Streptococcus cuniculi TaxID=1432788 RepID=A0A1Q8E9V4_9STRE|nr:hypothetical protein [Streptococcus cuniculi]OLF48574.1 hypothetical protein BU202_02860 [Streptococcus cuniculi]
MKKETLTKEQQDNVVRWIVRGYEIDSVEFMDFKKDKKTGFYLLNIQLNGDESLETTLSIRQLKELEEKDAIIGLNPIDRFQSIERDIALEGEIDLSQIKIKYLGD